MVQQEEPALEPGAPEQRIPLHVSNGKAYVWDAQDVAALRVHHRICGLTTGTLPGVAQQNAFLGLPLLLAPEEVVLLVSQRIASLVDTRAAHRAPTEQEVEDRTEERVQEAVGMQRAGEEAAQEKRRAFEAKRGKGGGGRKGAGPDSEEARRKREERRRENGEAQGEGDELFAPPAQERAEEAVPVTSSADAAPQDPTPRLASAAYFSAIPATSTSSAWFQPAEQGAVYNDLDAARIAGLWTYPATRLERARCATFKKVWEAGMFSGHGIKFGGEFLVYPGDPLRYHSHFVTTSLPSLHTVIRPLELVAWGRLGTATKKAHLLCAYAGEDEREGEDEGEVECWSLEWGNFG